MSKYYTDRIHLKMVKVRDSVCLKDSFALSLCPIFESFKLAVLAESSFLGDFVAHENRWLKRPPKLNSHLSRVDLKNI